MHKIKEMLMNELYEFEEKAKRMSGGKISTQELEKIHKLTDTIKNIDKIEMLEDGDYSEASDWMGEGRMYGMSYDGGTSYARDGRSGGKQGGGSSGSRVGYSGDHAKEHLIEKAEELLEIAQDEKERRAIHHFIKQLED